MPSLYARVLTLSEIERLQTSHRRAENELLQREGNCRICDATFRPGHSDVWTINALDLGQPLTPCRSRLIMPNIKRIKCSGVHFAKGIGPLGVSE